MQLKKADPADFGGGRTAEVMCEFLNRENTSNQIRGLRRQYVTICTMAMEIYGSYYEDIFKRLFLLKAREYFKERGTFSTNVQQRFLALIRARLTKRSQEIAQLERDFKYDQERPYMPLHYRNISDSEMQSLIAEGKAARKAVERQIDVMRGLTPDDFKLRIR